MAKKLFKKGQSGNPSGRPKLPQDVAEAKKVSSHEMILLFSRYMFLTDQEIKDRLADPKTPKAERILARILEMAERFGDHARFEFVLCRTIGKVTDTVEVKLPKPTIIERPNGTQVILGSKMDEEENT